MSASRYSDRPLLRPATVSVSVTATWDHRTGWSTRTTHRRAGESHWRRSDEYDRLTTPELIDVVAVELEAALGRLGPGED